MTLLGVYFANNRYTDRSRTALVPPAGRGCVVTVIMLELPYRPSSSAARANNSLRTDKSYEKLG